MFQHRKITVILFVSIVFSLASILGCYLEDVERYYLPIMIDKNVSFPGENYANEILALCHRVFVFRKVDVCDKRRKAWIHNLF